MKAKVIANSWVLKRYSPRPYPGRFHLLLTSESLSAPGAPRLAWRQMAAGRVEVHEIPGTHATISRAHGAVPDESHVRFLAAALKDCIEDALAD